MASIELKDVIVDFPIYNANTRSFKNTVLKATIGGKVDIYEQNINIRALDGIAFTLKDGDRLGLVGHNGAYRTYCGFHRRKWCWKKYIITLAWQSIYSVRRYSPD